MVRMLSSVRWLGVLLGLLVAVGMGLRLHQLDKRSLWVDELFTLAIAQYHPFAPETGQPVFRRVQVKEIADGDTFLTAKAAEQSPPLYDLLEKATTHWLGATEVAARLPAALASCALLLWFAGFAWRYPDDTVRRVLQWSLLLLAFHPALIMYAREGRAYGVGASLVGMAGLMWMVRWHKAWRVGWSAWQVPGWVETGLFTLACFSHYNAALLVALLLSADATMATRQRSRQAWIRFLVLGAVFGVWLVLNAHAIWFTSEGGVAWEQLPAWDRALMALRDALAVMHPPWLLLLMLVLTGLAAIQKYQSGWLWPVQQNQVAQAWALGGLVVVYTVLAAKVAATAGMAHPRYFIFVLPFVVVLMGLVLCRLRQGWLVWAVALFLLALAQPSARLNSSGNIDDLRAMTLSAVRGSDKDTVFLYPLVSNRNVYRVYLHRYLGEDPRLRMIGITSAQDAAQVCQQLKGHAHVVALGHDSGKSLTDAVYVTCGGQWSLRSAEQFYRTYAEHWRTP